MPLSFPTSPAALDAIDASWMHQPIVYLLVAAICLMVVLRFLKQALAPIGALIQLRVGDFSCVIERTVSHRLIGACCCQRRGNPPRPADQRSRRWRGGSIEIR